MRKFHANNYVKGKINSVLSGYVENGTISFEKGINKNTCIVILDENKLKDRLHENMLMKIVGKHKEIKE